VIDKPPHKAQPSAECSPDSDIVNTQQTTLLSKSTSFITDIFTNITR